MLFLCVYTVMCTMIRIWRSEGNLWKRAVSIHHMSELEPLGLEARVFTFWAISLDPGDF